MAVEKSVPGVARLTSLDVMRDAPVIPVIVLSDVAHAVPLARALLAGGIRMLEVTLRTPAALACIEAIAREVPEAVAGAGTVRSAADAKAAANAGARFAVQVVPAPQGGHRRRSATRGRVASSSGAKLVDAEGNETPTTSVTHR